MPTTTLIGSVGNDQLHGDGGINSFIGDTGNDSLYGGTGNDTYVFNVGDGSDTINDGGGTDTIRLGTTVNPTSATFNVSGFDLLINYGNAGDQIRIANQYLGPTGYQVETLTLNGGSPISLNCG